MLDRDGTRLARAGLMLFTAGLVLGAAMPAFASPRLALAAHTSALQCGTALIAFGLLWRHTGLQPRASSRLATVLALSNAALILGLTLAAVFGASRLEPIASGGRQGEPWQEIVVAVFVLGGSLGMLGACLGWLALWRRTA